MPLTPHKFVQIAGHHVVVYSLHSFYFCFYPIPIGLDILCVHSCCRVNKLNAVIDSLVLSNRGQVLDPIICCPLVAPDDCPWSDVLLDDGEEGRCVSGGYNVHNSQCWCVACVDHSKHPLVTGRSSATVVLRMM